MKTFNDQYISQLSQADMDEISALQRQLTVSISLEKGDWDKEPSIRLEGLIRDVFTADAEVRSASQLQAQQRRRKEPELSENFPDMYFFSPFGAGWSCWSLGG